MKNFACLLLMLVLLRHSDGTPGPVQFSRASPISQTGIEVEWFPPEELGVSDPALLQYQIAYNTEDTFNDSDSSTWNLTSVIPPGTSTTTYELESLKTGFTYSIAVLALNSTGASSPVTNILSATTFGKVSEDNIQNLVVNRSVDNRTIVAFWDPIETTPPFQPVEFYEYQYRDAGQGGGETTSSVPGSFNYAVIPNVVNANNYEFRVRAAYVTSQQDIEADQEFGYSSWTVWTRVTGVTDVIPPKPLSRSDDDLEPVVIIAIVVASVICLVLVALLLIAVLCCLKKNTCKRSASKTAPEEDENEMLGVGPEKPVSP